jgi:hypothetical protein
MGGLISRYGVTEYPHVSGGGACVSTHSRVAEPLVFLLGR